MWKKVVVVVLCAAVAAFSMGQTECQPVWPDAPFDATGGYEGTWQGQTTPGPEEKEDPQVIVACPLSMTLTQSTQPGLLGSYPIQGTVEVDYSCLELPEWVGEIPPSTTNVTGGLTADGKLTLLSGGCGTGVCVLLTMAGEGVDADLDGAMDTYSGAWSFIILLAGVQPFGVSGTFEVAAVD